MQNAIVWSEGHSQDFYQIFFLYEGGQSLGFICQLIKDGSWLVYKNNGGFLDLRFHREENAKIALLEAQEIL